MRKLTGKAMLGAVLLGFLGSGCVEDLLSIVPDDPYEPNNDYSVAENISASASISDAWMTLDSSDWYWFETSANGDVTVTCTPTGWDASGCTVTLYRDDMGSPVAPVVGTEAGGTITATQTPGSSGESYFVHVQRTGGPGGIYALTWTVTP